jgi:hypothetical protein
MTVLTTGIERSRASHSITLTVDSITAASAPAAAMDSTATDPLPSQQIAWSRAFDEVGTLRYLFVPRHEAGIQAEAGLISQSNAEREFEETREKMRSVSRFPVPRFGSTA